MIRTLPRVVPAAPGKPVRPEAVASQRRSREIAEDPGVWSGESAREVVRRYTRLAPEWDGERGGYRPVPLADALDRGGPFPAGLCVEVGAGTGLLTPHLAAVWPRVVSLDLTPEMMRRSRAPWRLIADASRLPLPDGAARAVVLADVPLFAAEVVRVLAPGGVVVWSNALGTDAPHHVPVDTVRTALDDAALDDAGGRRFAALTAEAGWGLWAVLR
ncbi:MAG: class I SAM-dependent methyltransferase [Actinophytocola sp.]|uniref:class I SAM-dependent methyltransferase n=1 Tax=Actinophytocola sp. TaxID=1872138 RepID=UPI003D6BD4CC